MANLEFTSPFVSEEMAQRLRNKDKSYWVEKIRKRCQGICLLQNELPDKDVNKLNEMFEVIFDEMLEITGFIGFTRSNDITYVLLELMEFPRTALPGQEFRERLYLTFPLDDID